MVRFNIISVIVISIVGGELLPKSPFMFIGENLLLNCTLPKSAEFEDLDISTAYFTKGDVILPKDNILISDDAALYNITITSTNDEARYGCWLETPMKMLGSQIVKVEYAPVAVTNVTCKVYDWTDGLRCDWSLGVDYIQKEFIEVTFWWSLPRGKYQSCPHLTNTSCTWTSSEFRGSSMMNIYVIVNNTRRNSAVNFLYVLRTSQHVQPSAPTDLNVVGSVEKTCITLNWGHEKSRPKLFSVSYVLRNKTLMEKVKVGSQNITLSICGLTPYTLYHFIVKCKPEQNGYWSDNKTIQVTTLQDVPLNGPTVSSGSYRVNICNRNTRTVVLYWGDVAEDDKQGEIIRYMISTPSENFTVSSDVHTLEILAEPCEQTQTYNIYSETIIGYSKDYSQIVVPDQKMVAVHNFTIQMVIVNDTERIIGTWLPVKLPETTNITYTVYWCLYDPARPLCQDGINWKISNQTDYIVLPLDSNIWRSYLYGISQDIDNISSGIQWTNCRITQSAVPNSPPEGIKVTEKENALDVRWKSEICEANSEALIHEYSIKICPTKSCDDESKVKTKRVASSKEQYLFKDLPSVNYSISLQAYSVAGAGPESSAVFAVPLRPDAENGLHSKWIIIIITVVVVLICFLCVCIWCNRKAICKKKIYKIKTPINKSASGQSPVYTGIDTNSPTHGLSTTSNMENGIANGVSLNPNNLSSPTLQKLLNNPVQNIDEIINEEEVLTVDIENNSAKLSNTKTETKTQNFMNPVFITSNGYSPNDPVKLENNTREQLDIAISNNTHMHFLKNAEVTDYMSIGQVNKDVAHGAIRSDDQAMSDYMSIDQVKNVSPSEPSVIRSDDQVMSDPGTAEVTDYMSIGQVNKDVAHGAIRSDDQAMSDYMSIGQVKDVSPSEPSVIRSDDQVMSDPGTAEVTDYMSIGQVNKDVAHGAIRSDDQAMSDYMSIDQVKNVLPSETSVIGSERISEPVSSNSVGASSSSEPSVSSYVTVDVSNPGYVTSELEVVSSEPSASVKKDNSG